MSDWLPFDSAPKDGTSVLARGPYRAAVIWWGDLNAPAREFDNYEPLWCWLGDYDCKNGPVFVRLDYLDPTHWMHIPELTKVPA